jgi:hypothetical protein
MAYKFLAIKYLAIIYLADTKPNGVSFCGQAVSAHPGKPADFGICGSSKAC